MARCPPSTANVSYTIPHGSLAYTKSPQTQLLTLDGTAAWELCFCCHGLGRQGSRYREVPCAGLQTTLRRSAQLRATASLPDSIRNRGHMTQMHREKGRGGTWTCTSPAAVRHPKASTMHARAEPTHSYPMLPTPAPCYLHSRLSALRLALTPSRPTALRSRVIDLLRAKRCFSSSVREESKEQVSNPGGLDIPFPIRDSESNSELLHGR